MVSFSAAGTSSGSSGFMIALREGWFIEKFERLAEEEDPFFYPIRYLIED